MAASTTVKQATLYDPAGKAKPVVVDVGSSKASELQKAGWTLNKVSTAMPKASVTPSSVANANTGQTLKAYNQQGGTVYVKPGEYNQGISLTNPALLSADQQKANADINAGQDAKIKETMEANGELPTFKGAIEDQNKIVEEYGSEFGYTDNSEKPKTISLKDEYAKLQETYKTSELETQLTDLQKEQKDIEARRRARKDYEASKPVAMGVISGKQSEIDKQEAELLDANLRQQDYLTNQLKNKYSTIETMMNLTQTDYTNAVSAYDKQFSQNMQVMNYLKGVQETVNTKANQVRDDARANLTLITNAITSGGTTYDALPEATKAQISKYEIMAGLPTGFTKALQNKNPKADILSTTTRQTSDGSKYADALLRDNNGKITVQSVYIGKEKISGTGSGVSAEEKERKQKVANFQKDAAEWIAKLDEKDSVTDQYKYEWGTAYDSMKTKYPEFESLIDEALGGGYNKDNENWYGRAKR
jgi:hypothetical protein